MYIEASRRKKGDNAKLEINPGLIPGKTCMSFFYSMRGGHNHMGTLSVFINGEQVFAKSGNQGNDWLKAQISYDGLVSLVRMTPGSHTQYIHKFMSICFQGPLMTVKQS